MNGQAPPSPPLSEVDDEDIEERSVEEVDHSPNAVLDRQLDPPSTKSSTNTGAQAALSPLTELSEVTPYVAPTVPPPHSSLRESPSIYSKHLTSEPEDIHLSNGTSVSPQRVASGSSTRTTGSLAVVRNSRKNLSALANGSIGRRSSTSSEAEIGQARADEINSGLEAPLGLEPLGSAGAVAGLGLGLPGQNGGKGKKLPSLPMASIIASNVDSGQLSDSPADYYPPGPLPSVTSGNNGSPQSASGAGPSNYLHPSSASSSNTFPPPTRVQRRNTNPTPNTPPMLSRSPLVHSHSTMLPPQSPGSSSHHGFPESHGQTDVPGVHGSALDPDILAQAEEIRRERISRRQKKLSANEEAAHPAEMQSPPQLQADRAQGIENPVANVKAPQTQEETRVLVGNLIGEDHVNYVLMYNMLTGIRIGVSYFSALRS